MLPCHKKVHEKMLENVLFDRHSPVKFLCSTSQDSERLWSFKRRRVSVIIDLPEEVLQTVTLLDYKTQGRPSQEGSSHKNLHHDQKRKNAGVKEMYCPPSARILQKLHTLVVC
jgi:hypothetical protein